MGKVLFIEPRGDAQPNDMSPVCPNNLLIMCWWNHSWQLEWSRMVEWWLTTPGSDAGRSLPGVPKKGAGGLGPPRHILPQMWPSVLMVMIKSRMPNINMLLTRYWYELPNRKHPNCSWQLRQRPGLSLVDSGVFGLIDYEGVKCLGGVEE